MKIKTIKVDGLNLNRLISEISNNKIKLLKVVKESHEKMVFEISSKEYKKLIDLKIAACYNIVVVNERPKASFLSMIVKRCGLIVGIAIMLMQIVCFNSRIWVINVDCGQQASEVDAQQVKDFLMSMGVCVGCKLELEPKDVEKQLLKQLSNASNVVVQKDGVKLSVTIKQGEEKHKLSDATIVSMFDGVIKSINYKSGILLVNIGESVTKGQSLIIPGKVGDLYSEANGEVLAKVRISGDAIGSIKTSSFKRTGNVTEFSYYELCGKKLFFEEDKISSVYKHYEEELAEVLISPNLVLPLKKCTTKVYELAESVEELSNAALITTLKEQAYKVAQNQLPSGVVEERVTYDVFNDGEYYRVVCNIQTTTNIGKRA